MCANPFTNRKGFGLLEVMMSLAFMALLSLSLMAVLELGSRGKQNINESQELIRYTNLVNQILAAPDICADTMIHARDNSLLTPSDGFTVPPVTDTGSGTASGGLTGLKSYALSKLQIPKTVSGSASGYDDYFLTSGTQQVKDLSALMGNSISLNIFPERLSKMGNEYQAELVFLFQKRNINNQSIGAPLLRSRVLMKLSFSAAGAFNGCAASIGSSVTLPSGVPTSTPTIGQLVIPKIGCEVVDYGYKGPVAFPTGYTVTDPQLMYACGSITDPRPTPCPTPVVPTPPANFGTNSAYGWYSTYVFPNPLRGWSRSDWTETTAYPAGQFPSETEPFCSNSVAEFGGRNIFQSPANLCDSFDPYIGDPGYNYGSKLKSFAAYLHGTTGDSDNCENPNPYTGACRCPKKTSPMVFWGFRNWPCLSGGFFSRPDSLTPAGSMATPQPNPEAGADPAFSSQITNGGKMQGCGKVIYVCLPTDWLTNTVSPNTVSAASKMTTIPVRRAYKAINFHLFTNGYNEIVSGYCVYGSPRVYHPECNEGIAFYVYANNLPAPAKANMIMLYRCQKVKGSGIHFVSTDPNCEGAPHYREGYYGYVYNAPVVSGLVQLHRFRSKVNPDDQVYTVGPAEIATLQADSNWAEDTSFSVWVPATENLDGLPLPTPTP